jgi:hypothetical protein
MSSDELERRSGILTHGLSGIRFICDYYPGSQQDKYIIEEMSIDSDNKRIMSLFFYSFEYLQIIIYSNYSALLYLITFNNHIIYVFMLYYLIIVHFLYLLTF